MIFMHIDLDIMYNTPVTKHQWLWIQEAQIEDYLQRANRNGPRAPFIVAT